MLSSTGTIKSVTGTNMDFEKTAVSIKEIPDIPKDLYWAKQAITGKVRMAR